MAQLNKLCIVLPPGLLALLELFHASGHMNAVYETLAPQIDQWLVVHYLQLALFPMTAWSVYLLFKFVNERFGRQAWMTSLVAACMAVYGIGFASFDSIAGIGTGILIKNTQQMLEVLETAPDAPRDFEQISNLTVQEYYHSPMVRYIFDVSKIAAIIGFALTAWKLHQAGCGWFPVMMLVGACYGVTKTHAPPYGPITYGFICAAGVAAVYFCQATKLSNPADASLRT